MERGGLIELLRYLFSEYKVKVKTGEHNGAGTDARVWVKLVGLKGQTTDEMELIDCGQGGTKNCFEGGYP